MGNKNKFEHFLHVAMLALITDEKNISFCHHEDELHCKNSDSSTVFVTHGTMCITNVM